MHLHFLSYVSILWKIVHFSHIIPLYTDVLQYIQYDYTLCSIIILQFVFLYFVFCSLYASNTHATFTLHKICLHFAKYLTFH